MPQIHIAATKKNGLWILFVRDNGIGIDMKYAERIFGAFQRMHSRTAYEGTGFGLAICGKTLKRHGGRIWVESIPGEGSTFYFSLRAIEERVSATKETKLC